MRRENKRKKSHLSKFEIVILPVEYEEPLFQPGYQAKTKLLIKVQGVHVAALEDTGADLTDSIERGKRVDEDLTI